MNSPASPDDDAILAIVHSEDGRFWWDGSQWQPAYSADGFLWFDGTSWRPRNWSPAVPPPRRRRRWWIGVLGALPIVVLLGLGVAGIVAFISFEDPYFDTVIDDDATYDAASEGCVDVTQAIMAAGTQDVAAGNAAIKALIAHVEAVGADAIDDDEPTRDWLGDWSALEAARAAAAGGEPFVVPRTPDGYPITGRMVDAGPEPCRHAVALAAAL